jgi:hypothetical protein
MRAFDLGLLNALREVLCWTLLNGRIQHLQLEVAGGLGRLGGDE